MEKIFKQIETYNFYLLFFTKIFTVLNILFFQTMYGQQSVDDDKKTIFDYSLKKVMEVDGRQGIAASGEYYVVSGSSELFLYNIQGELLNRNNSPFKKLSGQANHFGDIAIYEDEIYTGVENFKNGRGENIQIVVYNLADLKFKRSIPWNPSSGQVEVCGIAVDEKRKLIWLADWVNGNYVYKYDLISGKYAGRLKIDPAPEKIQGIIVYQDQIILTSDDGDADKNQHDHLYSVDIPGSKNTTESKLVFEKLLDEFVMAGEVEGLCLSDNNKELSILMNRGRRIINGIPMEFYPGYDREVHEVYIYNIERRTYAY